MREKAFENKIKKHLEEKGHWFVKYWGGGVFTRAGVPDLLCCIKGHFVAIEVKGTGGKLSSLQEHAIKEIQTSGGYGLVLYPDDFDYFKKFCERL